MKKLREITEEQLKHQEENRARRAAVSERKHRTHRLIVRGAIAEAAVESKVEDIKIAEISDEAFQNTLYELLK